MLFCSEDHHDLKQVIYKQGESAPKDPKNYKNDGSLFQVSE